MTERMGVLSSDGRCLQPSPLAARAMLRPAARRLAAVGIGFAGGWAVLYGALMPFGLGLVLGLALHHLIYAKIVITHFGGVWKVPVSSIALVVLLVAVSCVLAVHGPARRIRNMPITATINEL